MSHSLTCYCTHFISHTLYINVSTCQGFYSCYLDAVHSYQERAEKTAAGFAARLQEMALAMPQMCCALYLQAVGHPRQVCHPSPSAQTHEGNPNHSRSQVD